MMLSNRPYLLRAFYDWIVDSTCTPIIVLDAMNPQCRIPEGFSQGGEIIFNISPRAIRELKMGNQYVEFKASFSGVVNLISAPIQAVMAIYAEENGEGLYFDAEEMDTSANSNTPTNAPSNFAPQKLTSVTGSAVKETIPSITQETSPTEAATTKTKPVLKLVE